MTTAMTTLAIEAFGDLPDTDRTLPVSEQFSNTIQGEGPYAGRVVQFLRTGGCNLSCKFCVGPDTMVLMADWTRKPIADVQVGDLVQSFRNRRYEIARVEQVMTRHAEQRVTVVTDDVEIICTPDHTFPTKWEKGGSRRTEAKDLVGRKVRRAKLSAWLSDDSVRTEEWWTGWLQGLILGDGHIGTTEASPYPKVWLRVIDQQLADAYCAEVNQRGARCSVKVQKRKTSTGKTVYSVAHALSRVPEVAGLPDTPDEVAGFLAGFFDAEGHVGRNQIEMSQKDGKTLDRVWGMCRSLGIDATLKPAQGRQAVGRVVVNGVSNIDRFMRMTRPVLDRKRTKHRRPEALLAATPVRDVKEVDAGEVWNLTTSSGYFFANGVLVEQCDTPYTWDGRHFNLREELTPHSADDILQHITPGMDLVISGGEPLLHQDNAAWERLLVGSVSLGCRVHIETNGTIFPNEVTRQWAFYASISPKLPTFPMVRAKDNTELDPQWLEYIRESEQSLAQTASLKFVVNDAAGVDMAIEYATSRGWPRSRVWVMPEGISTEALQGRWPEIARRAADCGVNASHRIHVLAFGDQKGT